MHSPIETMMILIKKAKIALAMIIKIRPIPITVVMLCFLVNRTPTGIKML